MSESFPVLEIFACLSAFPHLFCIFTEISLNCKQCLFCRLMGKPRLPLCSCSRSLPSLFSSFKEIASHIFGNIGYSTVLWRGNCFLHSASIFLCFFGKGIVFSIVFPGHNGPVKQIVLLGFFWWFLKSLLPLTWLERYIKKKAVFAESQKVKMSDKYDHSWCGSAS